MFVKQFKELTCEQFVAMMKGYGIDAPNNPINLSVRFGNGHARIEWQVKQDGIEKQPDSPSDCGDDKRPDVAPNDADAKPTGESSPAPEDQAGKG